MPIWEQVDVKPDEDGWTPDGRCGATVTILEYPILIGGRNFREEDMKDAWALKPFGDNFRWRKLSESPVDFGARMMHSTVAVRDCVGDDWLWILGGVSKRNQEGYTDAWKFSPKTEKWMKVCIKHDDGGWLARWGHASFLCPHDPSKIWIFGGVRSNGFSNDLIELDTTKCTVVPLTVRALGQIVPRAFCTATTGDNRVIFFGGLSDENTESCPYALLDTQNLEWQESCTSPWKLFGHNTIKYQQRMLMFGGLAMHSGKSYFPNVPQVIDINCGRLSLSKVESVCPIVGRLHHSMFEYQECIMILGGIHKKTSPPTFSIGQELQLHKLVLPDLHNLRKVKGLDQVEDKAVIVDLTQEAEVAAPETQEMDSKLDEIRNLEKQVLKKRARLQKLLAGSEGDHKASPNVIDIANQQNCEFPADAQYLVMLRKEDTRLLRAIRRAGRRKFAFG